MIFKYLNYLDFLKDYFQEKREQKKISLRKFASSSEIDHTTLSRVLKGERKLPIDTAEKIANIIKLQPIEYEYFMLLVEFEHVRTNRAKKSLEYEIKSLQAQRNLPQAKKETFEIIADLTSFSILEAMRMDQSLKTPRLMADFLGVELSQVKSAFQRLVDSKVIQKKEDEEYERLQEPCNLKVNGANSTVEKYLGQVLDRAKEELATGLPNKRIYRTRVISIPKTQRQEICAMIDSFLGKLHLLTENSKQAKDDLVCLNVNFFSLLKK